jgi:hypothetical protein
MYVEPYFEALSCNHCCSGTALSITYSAFVFVDLGIQYAIFMRHVAICVLSSYTEFCTLSHKEYEFLYIQVVPGGMCQTSGECSLC